MFALYHSEVGVLLSPFVSGSAVGTPLQTKSHVLRMGYNMQMLGVDTASVAALVIDLHTVGDSSVHQQVHRSVDSGLLPHEGHSTIAITTGSPLPDQALPIGLRYGQ